MRSLRTRIKALETRARTRPAGRCGVVRCRPGESVEEAAERAYTDGYTACLVVPEIMEVEAWLAYVEADTQKREARNYELVGDILRREPRDDVEIVRR